MEIHASGSYGTVRYSWFSEQSNEKLLLRIYIYVWWCMCIECCLWQPEPSRLRFPWRARWECHFVQIRDSHVFPPISLANQKSWLWQPITFWTNLSNTGLLSRTVLPVGLYTGAIYTTGANSWYINRFYGYDTRYSSTNLCVSGIVHLKGYIFPKFNVKLPTFVVILTICLLKWGREMRPQSANFPALLSGF